MGYRYYICDVFTDTRFGGNQLAVLPEAHGLSDRQMQQVAREFNFSESAFVLPPERGHARQGQDLHTGGRGAIRRASEYRYRVVLGTIGASGPIDASLTVTFEEKAGLVPITIHRRQGTLWCQLSAPERLTLGKTVPAELLAAAVSLAPADIITTTHQPQWPRSACRFS